MNLQENIRRILREDHQFVRKHISDTNPHTGARNAFMGIPSLSRYDWDLIPKLIYPDDKKINKEMLYPASKRDVKRYMKQYIQGSEFPAIVLIDNGKEYSIADGQHRLSAAIKLGVPIYAYVGTEKPKLQESIRRVLREELNKPSESEFKQALKDVMSLIPLISHRILHDENMEHNEEIIVKLNKEILQKVIMGNDEILDEMWDLAGSMVVKHAINVITYYTK